MSRRFLAKSPVGFLPPANLGMAHCSRHFLTERGLYRARRRRRKRKQPELAQAVSKCALQRRGGDNRTPPKLLKGTPRRSFGFYLFLADASLLRSFEALLQAYIPCIQPSREPTADSGFSLISAFFGGCRFSSLPHKKRAPTMALIFLVGTTGLEPVTSRM